MSFETPEWARRAVWYQVFPERFRNGEPANDPPRTVPWTHRWEKPYRGAGKGGSAAAFEEKGSFFSYIYDRRYGGDLQGVREKLPCLRRLGITAIYFNPLFSAPSLHKYDTADYRHIDDHLAVAGSLSRIHGETPDPATWQWSESDRLFLDFLREAHAQGFRVILDGVFNHVGRGFWAFRDVLARGEKSPYAGWFDITGWKPLRYRAWDGDNGSLPRLRHDEALGLAPPVREHLFAVTRRWMDPDGDGDPRDGIDGWRLDVAGDIAAGFWRDWRRLVKSINPGAYLVAELWDESKKWLDGQTFDAVMNYPFARACQRFFVNRKKAAPAGDFAAELRRMLGWYPPQVNHALQNLFNSHDTDRLASMFMNPDLEYDQANRHQDNGPHYHAGRPTEECYERLKLMVSFQMTFVGAPMVYYGDEVGMYGADDPSCRKPMLWEDLMPFDDPDERILPDLREHYRRMIAIRRTCEELQTGSFETLLVDDARGLLAFARVLGGRSVVVVLNNSGHGHRVDVPVPWPAGAKVVRLDDPRACEIVEPENPADRPTVRPVAGHRTSLRVEAGRLQGTLVGRWGAAVFAVVAD
jgi:glycosidase